MVMITSTAPASAAALTARLAPACCKGSTLAAVRFQTQTSWPTSSNRKPIAAPILPTPATPIRMLVSSRLAVNTARVQPVLLACARRCRRCRQGGGRRAGLAGLGVDLGQYPLCQQHHGAAPELRVEPILARIEQGAEGADLFAELQDLLGDLAG